MFDFFLPLLLGSMFCEIVLVRWEVSAGEMFTCNNRSSLVKIPSTSCFVLGMAGFDAVSLDCTSDVNLSL